jgi:diguanylate cyclase (GGDEF)-like protein
MSHQRSLYSVLREALVSRDPVTGTLGRAAFERSVDSWVGRGAASRQPSSSLLLVQIDWGTRAGRTSRPGHRQAENVVRTVAQVASSCLRATDVLGRVDDEQFGVLLPATPSQQAEHVARRIRAAVSERTPKEGYPVTVSIGMATALTDHPWDQAFEALEEAILSGGNRLVIAEAPVRLRHAG